MVETIDPVVHGGSRKRYRRTVALHIVGAALSASATGALLALVGAWAGGPWGRGGVVVVLLAAGIYAAREGLGAPIPLPQRRGQVPEWWRTFFSPGVAALLYGAALGPGFFTYLSVGTVVPVAAAAAVSADPLLGAGLFGAFGIARALAIPLGTRGHRAGRLDLFDRGGSRLVLRSANAIVLGVVVAAALGSL